MRDPVQMHHPDVGVAMSGPVEPERWDQSASALRPLVAVLAEIAERVERERMAAETASDAA
jgi:hypothetical protein